MNTFEMIQILSASNDFNEEKVGVYLCHELIHSDGYVRRIEYSYTQKPEVRIFRDSNNLCQVDLIYEFPDDRDLLQQWMILDSFYRPENSCNFTDEDMDVYIRQNMAREEGRPVPEGEEIILSDHKLTLNIMSLSPKGKYSLTNIASPLFYMLVPKVPGETPATLRLIFQRDDVVFEELSDEELNEMYHEADEELRNEQPDRN